MRRYLAAIAIAIGAASVFATDAREETMGGTSLLYKDDQSIFTNPATIAEYDNMLLGSYGIYTKETGEDGYTQYNRDARKPYFGGTASFGSTEEKKSKFSVGAVFNRYDPLLDYVTPGNSKFVGGPKDHNIPEENYITDLAGKADLITAYTLNNGFTIGLGGYFAMQSDKKDNVVKAQTSVVKGTFGVAGPVSENVDFEASVGIGALTLKAIEDANYTTVSAADNDISISADVRAFAGVPAINGSFVPHIQANIIKHHTDETILDFNGGVGVNSYIDRGFFWAGFEGLYYNNSYAMYDSAMVSDGDSTSGKLSRIGGRVRFGIERNLLTDWLVWRVGGTKVLAYEKLDEGNLASYWVQNSEDDIVSFGMGVNIEDRFKVDAVVAENMLYTFSNLFSGNSHHFSSKISATFAF